VGVAEEGESFHAGGPARGQLMSGERGGGGVREGGPAIFERVGEGSANVVLKAADPSGKSPRKDRPPATRKKRKKNLFEKMPVLL